MVVVIEEDDLSIPVRVQHQDPGGLWFCRHCKDQLPGVPLSAIMDCGCHAARSLDGNRLVVHTTHRKEEERHRAAGKSCHGVASGKGQRTRKERPHSFRIEARFGLRRMPPHVVENVQVFHEEEEDEDAAGHDPEAYGELLPAWEVPDLARAGEGHDGDVQPVHHHTQDHHHRSNTHTCEAGTDGFDEHEYRRNHGGEGDLEEEKSTLPGAVQSHPQNASHGQIPKAQGQVDPEDHRGCQPQPGNLPGVELVSEKDVGEEGLNDHGHEPQRHRRHEELEVDEVGVPEGVEAVGCNEEQGSQRRLVQGGEHDSRDDQKNGNPLQSCKKGPKEGPLKELVLKDDREEFQGEDREIKHHAHGHFEQCRVVLPVEDGMPDPPWQSQVVEKTHRHGQIAQ